VTVNEVKDDDLIEKQISYQSAQTYASFDLI
jgi:hypothetical protein